MAEAGVGVDLQEISRMGQMISENPSLLKRVFTDEERAFCESSTRTIAHYASRYAARGAVAKALGLDPNCDLSDGDISVSRDERNKPVAVLSGKAADAAREQGIIEVALSLSLTQDLAVANAMAITEDARPKPKEDKLSEKAKIAQSFKEVRSVLDELERVQDIESIEVADATLES